MAEDEFRNFSFAELKDDFKWFVHPFRGLRTEKATAKTPGAYLAIKVAGEERPHFYVFSTKMARALAARLDAIADEVELDPDP